MEASLDGGGGGGGGPGLRFLLQLDPGKPALDRTLLGFSLSALLTRLLGRGRGAPAAAIAGDGGESGSTAAALAAAVSLSLAAAMYASDRRPPPRARRPPLPAPSSDSRAAARPRAPLPAPQDGLRILSSNDESLDNVIHGASIGAGDDDGPDIVARVEMDTAAPTVAETAEDETDQPDRSEQEEESQELERLRELWLSLVEREQRLELRLQELEGLSRAQEAAVRELEGRAAAAAAEERLLQLKLSTLQEENGRLRAQVDELGVVRAELARAKEKLFQVEQEEARREAAVLRATVAELERGRDESNRALAAEIAELRKANAALEEENLELALRLQDAEQAADGASVNLVLQEHMAEETKYLRLRESNERLTRQIEQLRNDHCAHVEELVYLKWVNACLRHELRDPTTGGEQQDHHHAGDGAAAGARDLTALELSKSMSFRSSERAKQLMLRYGHPGLDGFDNPGLFSPLHESSVDGDERSPARRYESERCPYYARTTTEKTAPTTPASAAAAAPGKKTGPRKLKFLGNIKKMLPGGKRSHSANGHGHASRDGRKAPAPAPAPSDEYLEKAMQWLSTHDVLGGDHSYDSTPLYSSCERTPLSSVTTNTTADDSRARGGGHSEHGGEAARRREAGPVMARSKSDAGRSYGREVSRYHALRPDHPAAGGVEEPDGFRAPEKREGRRRSEGLRSPVVT